MPYRYGYQRYSLGAGDGNGGYPPSNAIIPAWSPADLASITHWYRASDIVGLSNGDPVTTWADSAGSGDMGGSGSTRPLYYTNSGDPYVEFDGTDDTLNAAITAITANHTWCVVFERVSNSSFGRLAQTTNIYLFQNGTFDDMRIYWTLAGGLSRPTASAPTGFMAYYAAKTGTSGTARLNGSETTGTVINAAGDTALYLGSNSSGTENANVRIKEFILCNDDLTGTADFTSLATYISDTYGLTL